MVTERSSGSESDSMRTTYENILTDYATTITLVKITETKDSMNRVTATSEVQSTIKCDIQWVTNQDILHLPVGEVQIGDGKLFVLHDADIDLEDEVIYDGDRWRITSQIEGGLVQGDVIYKAFIIQKNK